MKKKRKKQARVGQLVREFRSRLQGTVPNGLTAIVKVTSGHANWPIII
jgi:hypothetical protein